MKNDAGCGGPGSSRTVTGAARREKRAAAARVCFPDRPRQFPWSRAQEGEEGQLRARAFLPGPGAGFPVRPVQGGEQAGGTRDPRGGPGATLRRALQPGKGPGCALTAVCCVVYDGHDWGPGDAGRALASTGQELASGWAGHGAENQTGGLNGVPLRAEEMSGLPEGKREFGFGHEVPVRPRGDACQVDAVPVDL